MLIGMAAAETLSPYIQFKDVNKAFGDRVVLKDVNFDVLPGEMVCILGRSGVGKSVALHNIMGFLKPRKPADAKTSWRTESPRLRYRP